MNKPDENGGNEPKPTVTLDDLLIEFQKNQNGNKTIQNQLNTIKTSVDANTATLDQHIKAYTTEILTINDKITKLDDTVNNMEDKVNSVTADILELKSENLELRKRLYEAESINKRFIGSEQEGKRRNVIIDGIKEAPFHKTKSEVTDLLKELDIEVSQMTVINMYRLGQQRVDDKIPRPVMVKFNSNLTKQTLYKNIANLKDKERWSRISIRDDMTEETQEIQRDLRCLAASARSKGHKAQVRGKALIIEDKKYTYDDIDELPFDLSLENAKVVVTPDGTAFQGKHAFLSNLAPCQIDEDGESFRCAEENILINKARLAKDKRSERKLRESEKVYDMIKIGKGIKQTDAWKQNEDKIVTKAACLKFSQNPHLLEKLKKIKGHIYEARMSKKWGCGFTIAQAAKIKHGETPGQNKFGVTLENIRDKALKGEDIFDCLK